MPLATIRDFLRLESAGGFVLLAAALLALILDNSPLAPVYDHLLHLPLGFDLGPIDFRKTLAHWINDGLMAIFFFLIGLEVKREIARGELSSAKSAALPGIAALGGMAVPAAIYVFVNRGAPENLVGWAIPAATDIAFALGVLSFLGNRVPLSLKVFLLALAILDDLGAIVIIAIFYSADLSWTALLLATIPLAALLLLNRCGVLRLWPYLLLGLALWACVLESGVHATLAGVLTAMTIPLGDKAGEASPLERAEHALHPWVGFLIMPLFAFANAGISLTGLTMEDWLAPVTLGIAAGLFLGKQIGVMLAILGGIALGLCRKPTGTHWGQIYGIAVLTGIGFTMSLFIGSLAFAGPEREAEIRLGVLMGSLASALLGYCVLRFAAPRAPLP